MKGGDSALAPIGILPVKNALGEGILWDSQGQQLVWTDILGQRLYRYDWALGRLDSLEMPERLASFGLVSGSKRLIAAFASGLAWYEPRDGAVSWLAPPEKLPPGVRFNDGRVDRQGRFWSGTMVEGDQPGVSAGLYSFDRTRGLRQHLSGIRISNSLCVSPDGRQLYFADSPTRTIRVFELDAVEGTLGVGRVFAQTPVGADPDGATVDADGCLWSAHWGAGCVVRYTPRGEVDRTVRILTRQPTCVCFGGPGLDTLCVTTARVGLEDVSAEPGAGDVFLYRVGVTGVPEARYQP